MFTLENDQLSIDILDPVADQERMGARYCTGGYIFQITDRDRGPLLTGPTYPDSFNVFDGQGIPDAFNHLSVEDTTGEAQQTLIIGVGQYSTSEKTIEAFCNWDIEQVSGAMFFQTAQTFHDISLRLERKLHLSGRTLLSTTRLKNEGSSKIPVRWYPHPFYPQPNSDELCRFNIDVQFPNNDGYEFAPSGFVARKDWPNWQEGHYQVLDHNAKTNLVVFQKHPIVGLVAATCSYVPGFFPIWGNSNTFSWEPYFEQEVGLAESAEWFIAYEF